LITTDLTGNLGNHMWEYAICRIVAEHNGYEWGFNRTPSHDYYQGMEQMDFMEIDYGQEHDAPFGQLPVGIDKVWVEKKESFNYLGITNFHPYQPDIFDIQDNTKLVIECCQNEQYIQHRKDDIRKWFKIKEENVLKYQQILKDNNLVLDENLCVINVRGGSEYLSMPTVLLDIEYWKNAIVHMQAVNSDMKFIVISDDMEYARSILPYPVYHFSIGMDYFVVNQAHYLILSNSSFALFPAWLNTNCKQIVAPKYWARHNISFGYWASSNVYMDGWEYLDREGVLYNYGEVVSEETAKELCDRKVYDAILFFNELDLLEIRLNTLDPLVDFFIISESTRTHSGLEKPLYYFENKARFKQFEHKIIHQVIDDTPDDYTNLLESIAKDELHRLVIKKVNGGDWWPRDVPSYGRDTYEKECLLRAMANCRPEDIIMFSDADEIPNPEIVDLIVKNFNPEQIYNLKQKMYFYYFNILKEDDWVGNTILSFEKFRKLSACELRVRRRGIMVEEGGWHFSFMGGADRIRQKIESYGEQSLNTALIKENIQNNVDRCIEYGHDLFFRPCKFSMVCIDQSYPPFLFKNIDKFAGYLKNEDNSLRRQVYSMLGLYRNFGRKGKVLIMLFLRKVRNVVQYLREN